MRSWSSYDVLSDVGGELHEAGAQTQGDQGAVEAAQPARNAHSQTTLVLVLFTE